MLPLQAISGGLQPPVAMTKVGGEQATRRLPEFLSRIDSFFRMGEQGINTWGS
jgi:hypothetical protein